LLCVFIVDLERPNARCVTRTAGRIRGHSIRPSNACCRRCRATARLSERSRSTLAVVLPPFNALFALAARASAVSTKLGVSSLPMITLLGGLEV
jgi:hypothetical protein